MTQKTFFISLPGEAGKRLDIHPKSNGGALLVVTKVDALRLPYGTNILLSLTAEQVAELREGLA